MKETCALENLLVLFDKLMAGESRKRAGFSFLQGVGGGSVGVAIEKVFML